MESSNAQKHRILKIRKEKTMKRNHDAICSNCPYWSITDGDNTGNLKRGECRIDKPHPIYHDGVVAVYFPPIGPTGWCAKHPDFKDTGKPMGFIQGEGQEI